MNAKKLLKDHNLYLQILTKFNCFNSLYFLSSDIDRKQKLACNLVSHTNTSRVFCILVVFVPFVVSNWQHSYHYGRLQLELEWSRVVVPFTSTSYTIQTFILDPIHFHSFK